MTDARSDRLREILQFAVEHVPRYTAMRASGEPTDRLASFPIVTRADVARDPARFMRADLDVVSCPRTRSSGTTGRPLEVMWDPAAAMLDESTLVEAIERTFEPASAVIHHLVLHAGPVSRGSPMLAAPSWQTSKWNLFSAWRTGPAALTTALARTHGTVVATLPSIFRLVVAAIDGAPWRPAGLILSGEEVRAADVELAEATIGRRPLAIYATAEHGIVGVGCPDGGYHENDDAVCIEIENAGATPSRILVTTLANLAMPLIRYDTGDLGAWLGTCTCGRSSRRFTVVNGRDARPGHELGLVAERSLRHLVGRLGLDVKDVSRRTEECELTCGPARALPGELVDELAGAVRTISPSSGGLDVDTAGSADLRLRVRIGRCGFAADEIESLRGTLGELFDGREDLLAAAFVGSSVDDVAPSRYSDVDVVVVCRSPAMTTDWVPTIAAARTRFPQLAIGVDGVDELPGRAPLLVCRLLARHLPIRGDVASAGLRRPTRDELRAARRQFLVAARMDLLDALTRPGVEREPAILLHRIVAKRVLELARFRVASELLEAGTGVDLGPLASAAVLRAQLPEMLLEALDVAAEVAPPPVGAPIAVIGCALEIVESELGTLG